MDNISVSLYMQAAKALKIPMEYCGEFAGVLVRLAGKIYYFRKGYTPFNAGSSDDVAVINIRSIIFLKKPDFQFLVLT